MSPQGPHFSPQSTAKSNDKITNLTKNGIYWLSVVVTASLNSEKIRMKKCMMIMIIISISRKAFTSK